MKKSLVFIIISLFLISFIFAQQNQERKNSENEEQICCKIYGLGNMMEEVNIYYERTSKENCKIPEEFVGGGREIVDDEFCENMIRKITEKKNQLRIQDQNLDCPENCKCQGSVIICEIDGKRNMTISAGKSGNTIVQIKEINMSTNVQLYRSEEKLYGNFKNNQTKEIKILPDEAQERLKERTRNKLENTNIELDENGIYQIRAEKKARLFFLFPIKKHVQAKISSEDGEIIQIKNPWWGFLAKDISE